MAKRQLPPPEVLRQLLRYEPDTGKLFWHRRDVSFFNSTPSRTARHAANHWNSKYSGKEAFTTTEPTGYKSGSIFDKIYLAHRVAWSLHRGDPIEGEIDHINGVRNDNRFTNLRDVSHLENMRNLSRPKNSSTPMVGVSKTKWGWHARIGNLGQVISLGVFESLKDAQNARLKGEEALGFHPNHGRLS